MLNSPETKLSTILDIRERKDNFVIAPPLPMGVSYQASHNRQPIQAQPKNQEVHTIDTCKFIIIINTNNNKFI